MRSPLAVLYHISPASAVACIPVFLVIELDEFLDSKFARSPDLIFEAALIIVGGGIIAFLLIFAEVKLVKISSSLTMGMFGNLKEVVTITLSIMIFGDRVTFLNVTGLMIAVLGATWYRKYKLSEASKPQEQYMAAHAGLWDIDDNDELL